MYQVMTELLTRKHGQVHGLGYCPPPDPRVFAPEQQAIVKWHITSPAHVVRAAPEHVRIIYSYRDLRDVAYSFAHKGMMPLPQAMANLPGLVGLNAFWEAQPLAATMRYEQFWQDSRAEVVKLADLLGIDDDTTIDTVNAMFSFAENTRAAKQRADDLARHGVVLSNLGASCSMAHHGLLHWNHLRKGTGGEWRTAPAPMVRELSRILTPWLIHKRYEQDADWAERLLASRQQGGCGGETKTEAKEDSQAQQPEHRSATGSPAVDSPAPG